MFSFKIYKEGSCLDMKSTKNHQKGSVKNIMAHKHNTQRIEELILKMKQEKKDEAKEEI